MKKVLLINVILSVAFIYACTDKHEIEPDLNNSDLQQYETWHPQNPVKSNEDSDNKLFKTARSNLKREQYPNVPYTDINTLERDNALFAFDLYKTLINKRSKKNLFVCPYSISLAMSMTYAGARGGTANEIARTMHFDLPQEKLHPAFNYLDLELTRKVQEYQFEGYDFELSIANALWGQAGFKFNRSFLDTLAINYGAGLNLLDFANQPEESIKIINQWVSEKTHGKIKDLLSSDSIGNKTFLIITDAIYFKADWKISFDKDLTKIKPFHALDGTKVNVKMMDMGDNDVFPYIQTNDYQMVALPYEGDDLSMVLLLPEKGKFDKVEKELNGDKFLDMLDSLTDREGSVSMPSFELRDSMSLKKTFKSMGMQTPFGALADFSGITTDVYLYIDDIIHKTFLKINEKGSEAAGATAVIIMYDSGIGGNEEPPPEPFRMVLDRPFIYAIVDRRTDTILFIGRMVKPTPN